jgi:hypothetical protein
VILRLINALPEHFRWTIHNLVAHPLGEVLHLIGFTEIGNRIHDATVPTHQAGTGRG